MNEKTFQDMTSAYPDERRKTVPLTLEHFRAWHEGPFNDHINEDNEKIDTWGKMNQDKIDAIEKEVRLIAEGLKSMLEKQTLAIQLGVAASTIICALFLWILHDRDREFQEVKKTQAEAVSSITRITTLMEIYGKRDDLHGEMIKKNTDRLNQRSTK
jgi:hypothetical protein